MIDRCAKLLISSLLALACQGVLGAEPMQLRNDDKTITLPMDDQGNVLLRCQRCPDGGQAVSRSHLRPRGKHPIEHVRERGDLCLRVCSNLGVGVPIPGVSAWNSACLRT